MKTNVVETYYFNTLPKDLEFSLYGVLTYLNTLYSHFEEKEEIKKALQEYLEFYITLPVYVQEKPLYREYLLIDTFFFHAYIKFHDINDYLSILFEKLDAPGSTNNLPLEDFNRLVAYLTDIGEGLAEEFYPLSESDSVQINPIRLYLAVEVLKEIGYDDSSFYPFLKESYYPFKKISIQYSTDPQVVSLSGEIQKLKTLVKGKEKVDSDMAALYFKLLQGKDEITGPITLEKFITKNIKNLKAVNFYKETKTRLIIKLIMLFIIHGIYIVLLYKYFLKRKRCFIVPLAITIFLTALLLYLWFSRIPPAALWYQSPFLSAAVGAFIPVLIFIITMRIFKNKIEMSEDKEGGI